LVARARERSGLDEEVDAILDATSMAGWGAASDSGERESAGASDAEDLTTYLRQCRRNARPDPLTQREAAELVGLSVDWYRTIEQGRGNPTDLQQEGGWEDLSIPQRFYIDLGDGRQNRGSVLDRWEVEQRKRDRGRPTQVRGSVQAIQARGPYKTSRPGRLRTAP
jgi:hypothetical protein